jgi:hypothetical protein
MFRRLRGKVDQYYRKSYQKSLLFFSNVTLRECGPHEFVLCLIVVITLRRHPKCNEGSSEFVYVFF